MVTNHTNSLDLPVGVGRMVPVYIKKESNQERKMQTFNIPNMTCGHCKATVEGAILELDSGAKITIDLETQNVDVDTQTAAGVIIEALKTAGYEATPT